MEPEKPVVKNPKTKQPAKPLPKQIEKPKPRSDKVTPPGKSYESLIGRTKSVKDIEEYPRCPWRFYVRGRLSGYWPLDLADFVVLHCNKCNETYVCIIFPMRSNIYTFWFLPSALQGILKSARNVWKTCQIHLYNRDTDSSWRSRTKMGIVLRSRSLRMT